MSLENPNWRHSSDPWRTADAGASLRKRAAAAWTNASEAFDKLGLNLHRLLYRRAAAAESSDLWITAAKSVVTFGGGADA
jgi:hypothetical protein